MNKIPLILILVSCCTVLSAQFGPGGRGGGGAKIVGKISGTVIDSTTNQPVSFATISMRKNGRSKIVNGTLSEDDGSFSFTDVKPGKYDLEISFIGYTAKILDSLVTTKKKLDLNVGTVYLLPENFVLDEVEVT